MKGSRSRCKLSFFLFPKLERREFGLNLNGQSPFRNGCALTTHYAICDGVRYRSTVQSRSKGAAAAANLTISLAAARMTQSTPAQEICLPRDRCRNGAHLDFCAAGFLWHIQQKLA